MNKLAFLKFNFVIVSPKPPPPGVRVYFLEIYTLDSMYLYWRLLEKFLNPLSMRISLQTDMNIMNESFVSFQFTYCLFI